MKRLEKELIELGIEEYFPEDSEKVVIDEEYQTEENEIIKKVIVAKMKGNKDISKAIKQGHFKRTE